MKATHLLGRATAVGTIVLALASALTLPASADPFDPVKACRTALTQAGVLKGGCFWAEENFQGALTLDTNPAPPGICGDRIPQAGSMANLTQSPRDLYLGGDCVSSNHLGRVDIDDSYAGGDPGVYIGSWR